MREEKLNVQNILENILYLIAQHAADRLNLISYI
jgi:hypothetical protein